jgi:hypothetical protein
MCAWHSNLQHHRAESATGETVPVNSGHRAMWVAEISATETTPACLTSCAGSTSTATIAPGSCFVGGECYSSGATSATMACFACDAAISQTSFQGPNTANHCYMGGSCIPQGAFAPAYQRYNQGSVCEWCNPSVNPFGYSVRAGYIHDRDLALVENGRNGRRLSTQTNAYSMVFDVSSNGCQLLPSLAMPTTMPTALSSAVGAAAVAATVRAGSLAAASSGISSIATAHSATMRITAEQAVSGVGPFLGVSASARKAFIDAMATDILPVHNALELLTADSMSLSAWQVAWAYYSGNTASCTRNAAGACMHTPSATAVDHAVPFGTDLHYGHAVASVKAQQSMALGAANSENVAPDAALAQSFVLDTRMHMLVPYLQGILAMAEQMDVAPTASLRKEAQLRGYAYYSLVRNVLAASAQSGAAGAWLRRLTFRTRCAQCASYSVPERMRTLTLAVRRALCVCLTRDRRRTPLRADLERSERQLLRGQGSRRGQPAECLDAAVHDGARERLDASGCGHQRVGPPHPHRPGRYGQRHHELLALGKLRVP